MWGVRISNADRSLRRELGILLRAAQASEVLGMITPCVDQSLGGRRSLKQPTTCRCLSVYSRPTFEVSEVDPGFRTSGRDR